MFEADDQVIVDEYLSGLISQKHFEKESKLWPNYKTDYKPLIEFAREEELSFIATNIPRRYASIVAKEGFDRLNGLSGSAKQWIAPLPVKYDPDLPGYQKMLKMGAMHGNKRHMHKNLPKAQAIKDATMAHFILQNLEQGEHFLDFNGTYHSNNKEGIIWYIKQHAPELSVGSIATVRQKDLDRLQEINKGKADFILVVPADMTNTH